MKPGGNAQSTIEFTFAMVVTVLLIVGMVKVFFWSGSELAQRRQQNDRVLTDQQACPNKADCAYNQLIPDFFQGSSIGAAVPANIYR